MLRAAHKLMTSAAVGLGCSRSAARCLGSRTVWRQAPAPRGASSSNLVRCRAASGGAYPPAQDDPFAALQVVSVATDPFAWKGDALVIGVCEEALGAEGSIDNADLKNLDDTFGGLLAEMMKEAEFKAKPGSSVFCRAAAGALGVKHVGVVGVGKSGEVKPETWAALGSAATAHAQKHKCVTAAVTVVGGPTAVLTPDAAKLAAKSIATGAYLGSYEDQRFKSKPTAKTLARVEILGGPYAALELHAVSVAAARAAAAGIVLTKELVAAPPNVVTPTALADVAAMIAAKFPGCMSLKVLDKVECEKLGMGSFLGVSEASDEPPKFIHLTYTSPAAGADVKKIALVGKGLTFDSGGYNIKAGAGSMIEMMKFDMGGAGAVLGAARTIAETQPPGVEVHFIIASCENMIGSRGMRPGDILTASNGKTIEVNNTDAEGRLTLADALVYAEQTVGCTSIVDVATLTGAVIVALGPEVAGLFSPSDKMAESLMAAAAAAGEQFWRMPMTESYWANMKSDIADMKNTGSRGGGAITAALFLKQFVEKEGTEWAHLDIAGPVWDDKKGGATGFAAATLANWVAAAAARP
mmetsp:Transcript_3341/g.7808  ORF Transcript_3341/g.7808 Transcript_3341/m.7808 type:complete len:582 (-) Transcript_3341:141-1886(-)